MERIWHDHERCYRALASRDARFDGRFYAAVRSTGIYCRPSCPARPARPGNVEFVPTAAAAQQRGYRACKRCRPDATPGSPDWDVRADVVARAMRLVCDGLVDREGVGGLARRLGYSSRQLQRILVAEVGAGPLALARAQRAHTARLLLETTTLTITDVAFAAGFSSVRQFNDTIRAVYDTTPSALRSTAIAGASTAPSPSGCTRVTLRLAARPPFAGHALLGFLGARAIPGLEAFDGEEYRRALALPRGHGVARLRAERDAIGLTLWLEDWRDVAPAVQRVRRLVDVDADPVAVDEVLSCDPVLSAHVAAVPGRRVPGSVDVFETAIRAVVGQQVSIVGARTVAARLVSSVGEPLRIRDEIVTRVFPTAERLAAAGDDALAMPRARRGAIRGLAAAVAGGSVRLDHGVDRDETRRTLLELDGIGPWTADYVVMRGLHDPDVFLGGDLGVRRALAALGADRATDGDPSSRWRPWRSYALHHLWAGPPEDR